MAEIILCNGLQAQVSGIGKMADSLKADRESVLSNAKKIRQQVCIYYNSPLFSFPGCKDLYLRMKFLPRAGNFGAGSFNWMALMACKYLPTYVCMYLSKTIPTRAPTLGRI
jgi:hypothetical protein